MITEVLTAAFSFAADSAPGLVLGFLCGGLLNTYFSPSKMSSLVGRPGPKSVLVASAVGLPLPLCSCSVVPVAVEFQKKGASCGATAAFLVSTPEIGVDSFILSYSLLGLPITLVRVVASFVSAALVGTVIDATDKTTPLLQDEEGATCCSTNAPCSKNATSRGNRLTAAVRYGFTTLVDDTAGLLLLAFLIAGIITVAIPSDLLGVVGPGSIQALFIALVISLPMYVCASSSTPLAAAFIAKGLSPGAAVVFLLAGPASNAATITALSKQLGPRALAIYVAGVSVVAVLAGYLTDVMGIMPSLSGQGTLHDHDTPSAWLAVGLLFYLGWRVARKWLHRK